MDFLKYKTRIIRWIGKYKYIGVVLLAGIILMALPDREQVNEPIQVQQVRTENKTSGMEEQLANILGHISGAGRVEVMLTIAQGERTIYQTDSTYSQGDLNTDSRTETIIITDADRNETGLIHQINPPVYQGAIVLAQGAENAQVKLSIVEAVMDITGLGADRISVLKMQ